MFEAINSANSEDVRKAEKEEEEKLKVAYSRALVSLDLDLFIDQKPKYASNSFLYGRLFCYLVANYSDKKHTDELESNMERYGLLDYSEAVFNIARRYIEAECFMKARKLLNIARERGYITNMLYELEEELERRWFLNL